MRKLICDRHNDIISWAQDIKKLIENVEKAGLKRRINSLVTKIEKETEKALDSGQSMENRLAKYRSAIDDLGFKRK